MAEDYVQMHFEKQGYALMARHHRTPFGEIDLLMQYRAGLFMIEVKAIHHFEMLERIQRSKQLERLKRVYRYLCDQHDQPVYAILAVIENFQKLYIFENFLES